MRTFLPKRFRSSVDFVWDDCWTWNGPLHPQGGYGVGPYNKPAQRWSYELHHGKIPKDKKVVATCGKVLCVNPAHLYLKKTWEL
jgi:HNH endonuclease